MITAVYFDTTTGRIDQILPFDDGTASATIDGFAVPGTDWLDLPDANITEDYIDDPSGTPTLTERPVLYETDKVALLPDGTETITFPVPSGTLVDFEDADDYTTAGADFSFTPPGVGEWVIGFDPPWPYVPLLLTVTAATRQVQSVGIAPSAVVPSKFYRNPAGNLVTDFECLEVENLYFYEQDPGTFVWTDLPAANITQSVNPAVDDFGESDYKFSAVGVNAGHDIVVESDRLSPVVPGRRYEASFFISSPNTNTMRPKVGVRWWGTDTDGSLILIDSDLDLVQGDGVSAGSSGRVFCAVLAPAGVSFASVVAVVYHALAGTAEIPSIDYSSPVIRDLPNAKDIAEISQDFTAADQSFGNVDQIIATAHLTNTEYRNFRALVKWGFKNRSGSAKDFTIQCLYFTGGSYGVGGSTVGYIFETMTINVRDDAWVSGEFYTDTDVPSSNSLTANNFELVVSTGTTGNVVNNVRLIVDARFIEQVDN